MTMRVTAGLLFSSISTLIASMASANLIVNGDFESGNTGFSTDMTLNPLLSATGTYAILMNPRDVNVNFASFGDHTSGSGLMMAINGSANSANEVAWAQSVSVMPGSNYEFSAWVSIVAGFPESYRFQINGVTIRPDFTTLTPNGTWHQFAASWNSGSATNALIEIVQLRFGSSGLDYALDDISFVPEPTVAFLLAIGVAGLTWRKGPSPPQRHSRT
jgi:hypothetical protein